MSRRDNYLKAKYGISEEDYWAIYRAQGKKCAICKVATGKSKHLSVDHDHKTGLIRGLVCMPCNFKGLGWYEKYEANIRDYLLEPPARKVLRARGSQK